jgi:hypothetical protein
VIEQLEPALSKAAESYAEAVAQLPGEISSNRLVNGGPAVVAAYQVATAAASRIDSVSGFVASTGALSGITPNQQDRVLRVVAPESPADLADLDAAQQTNLANPEVRALNPRYLTAVRLQVPFRILTPSEAVRCVDP